MQHAMTAWSVVKACGRYALCFCLQLMRRILDSPGQLAGQLRALINKAKQAQLPPPETATGYAHMASSPTHTARTASAAAAAGPGISTAQPPVVQLSPEGDRLVQGRGKKEMQLPLSMAEALLQACDSLDQQQQQQQVSEGAAAAAAEAVGSNAAALPAAGSSTGPAAAAAAEADVELGLLPKEAFVLQLVRECCGSATELKQEKVVVYSQVRCGRVWL